MKVIIKKHDQIEEHIDLAKVLIEDDEGEQMTLAELIILLTTHMKASFAVFPEVQTKLQQLFDEQIQN